LAKTLREILAELHESTLHEIRKRVEEQTNAIFSKLISRRWQLDKVIISPDYKIRVLDKEGVDNLKTLSAGQTLYLSLSFISALRQITATNYPMVIDSPFGKVSGEERIWAAEDLPIFLPDTQITFLVTDTEYSSDVSNILTNTKIPSIREVLLKNNKVWKEFNLVISKEDDVSSKTEVVEYVKV
jgi:DNA sulfur modification protein DndD